MFLVWYITHLHQDNGRPLLIGVTAFTRHAIMNLLERVSIVRNRHQATAATNFEIISMGSDSRKLDDMILCKAEQLRKEFQALGGKAKAVVVGGTVWDWYKVKNKWQDKHHWKGCDMMIIDESSQARTLQVEPVFPSISLTDGYLPSFLTAFGCRCCTGY